MVLSAAQAVHGCVAIGGGGLWLDTASAADTTDRVACSLTADGSVGGGSNARLLSVSVVVALLALTAGGPVGGASTATIVSPSVEAGCGSTQLAPLTPLTLPPALSQLTVLSAAEASTKSAL